MCRRRSRSWVSVGVPAIDITSPCRGEIGRGSGRVGPFWYVENRNPGRSELSSLGLTARLSRRESVEVRNLKTETWFAVRPNLDRVALEGSRDCGIRPAAIQDRPRSTNDFTSIHQEENHMRELELAKQAAIAGGAILTKYFEGGLPEARQKDPGKTYDLVSQADLESEEMIVRLIRDAFPDHEILAEEGQRGATDAEHLWVVDPLDGTTNFLHQIPHYAVSIAYYRDGQAICGVVYNPSRNDWYEAVKGQGARYQGKPIQVAECARLDQALVGIGFYYDRGAMMQATLDATRDLFEQQIHGIRRFGTASLDLAQVATGAVGAYFEYELSPWDFAAGRLLVEEAGGQVTDCKGDKLPLKKGSVLASNSVLHPAVLAITRKHFPSAASE